MKDHAKNNQINSKYLEWDSGFLGFPVWEMSLPEKVDESQIKKILEEKRRAGVKLIYAHLSGAEKSSEVIEREGGLLVDRKLTFSKTIELPSPFLELPDTEIKRLASETSTTKVYEQKLIELAWEAGHFSRFRLDPQFPELKFKELYRTWLLRSLAGEMAKVVLVKENPSGIPVGFVTINLVGSIGVIGLIAVDSSCRGQGIGSQLVRGALVEMYKLGAKNAQVITQRENQGACLLYHRTGFSILSEVVRYHFWL